MDEPIELSSPVSVVIPLYNHERFIAAAIRSIQHQQQPIREIIIIDDGSTDDSFAAASAASAGDERIRLIRQDNAGAATTINRAIALCRGAIVAILNSDDCFHKDRLCVMVRWMVEHQVEFVFSRITVIDGEDQILDRSWFDDAAAFWHMSGRLDLALIRANFIGTTSNVVMTKRVFAQIGGFAPITYCHDLDFFLRAMRAGIVIAGVDEPLLFYRKHGTNTITTAPNHAVALEHAAVAAQHVASCIISKGVDTETLREVRRALAVYAQDSVMMTRFTMALSAALASPNTVLAWLPALQALDHTYGDRTYAATSFVARYPYDALAVWGTGLKVEDEVIFLHPGPVGTASALIFRMVLDNGCYLFSARLTVSDAKSQPVSFEIVVTAAEITIGAYAITLDGGQSLTVSVPFTTSGGSVNLVLRTQMSATANNNYYAHAYFIRPLIRPVMAVAPPPLPIISHQRRVFVVLGMHRAGTSLCMQILHRLGVHIGGPLMAATAANPDGYWEHLDIHQQHEALLSLLGKTWSTPGISQVMPSDWWDSPAVRNIRTTLRDLVAYELEAGAGDWGFKDPRTVRFIPLWQHIFAELEVEPIWILAVRHPLAVAKSLHQRDHIPREVGEILWIEHYLDAVRYLGGQITAIIRYENWFSAPLAQGYRLARVTRCDDIDRLIQLDQIIRTSVKPWLYRQQPLNDDPANLPLAITINTWFDQQPAALASLVEIATAIAQGTALGMRIAAVNY